MPTFNLLLSTPQGTLFEGTVRAFRAPGTRGSFGVLANHAPLIAGLRAGPLTIRDESGAEKHFAVGVGVVEVADNKAYMLCGTAKPCSSREEARTQSLTFVQN